MKDKDPIILHLSLMTKEQRELTSRTAMVEYLCGLKDTESAYSSIEDVEVELSDKYNDLCEGCFSHPKVALRLLGGLL